MRRAASRAWVLFLGRKWRQMQLVVDLQHAGGSCVGDRPDTGRGALEERLEKGTDVGRQAQAAIVSTPCFPPAFLRNEQLLAAAKRKTMLDPHRAVSERSAQVQQRRDLTGGEGALPIFTREHSTPDAAQRNCERRRERAQVAFVQITQHTHRFEHAAARLLGGLGPIFPTIKTVIADAGHQSRKLTILIKTERYELRIVKRRKRAFEVVGLTWIVERTFAWI